MRIAQIMFSDGWGGAERFFVELCSGLNESKHEVLAVCKPAFEHGALLREQKNLQYATVPARCNWDYLSVLKLKRLVQEFRPDVIHAHLARASWMTGLVGSTLNIPTLSTTHNRIKEKYISRINYFTTITGELTTYLERLGVESSKIKKIPNFSLVTPVEQITSHRHTPLVFVALGRFVHKKGFDLLLRGFKGFIDTSPAPARLILAGDGPLNHQLRTLAAQLGIAHLVEFTGWVDDVASLLDSGDIFVLASRDEPFGIVLLEAMARGKVIITTDVSGPRDFLNQETAFFVQPDDGEGMSLAMKKAADNPDLCFAKALAALQLFRGKYTRGAVLPEFISFYENIREAHT